MVSLPFGCAKVLEPRAGRTRVTFNRKVGFHNNLGTREWRSLEVGHRGDKVEAQGRGLPTSL